MSRVFLKKLKFFFEKLKILLYNVRNIRINMGDIEWEFLFLLSVLEHSWL